MSEDAVIDAVSVAVRRGNTLLLVKRGRAPSFGLYAFPGGRVEPGETSEEAARRELFEETGLRAGRVELHTTLLLAPEGDGAGRRYRLQVFLCDDAKGIPGAASDAAEAGFFSLEEMHRLPITPSTWDVARAVLGADENR